jgi:hypothetical protein
LLIQQYTPRPAGTYFEDTPLMFMRVGNAPEVVRYDLFWIKSELKARERHEDKKCKKHLDTSATKGIYLIFSASR